MLGVDLDSPTDDPWEGEGESTDWALMDRPTSASAARDGELLYDNDEYIYAEDRELVRTEIRPLFDLARVDLDDDSDDDGADPIAVGLAMAEVITGIELTAAQVAEVDDAGFFSAPGLVYVKSL